MKLVLGTVQFGMDYGIQGGKRPKEKDVEEILSYAADHGIHYFDSASAYGNAEKVVGNYIKHHTDRADQMKMISKLSASALREIPTNAWRHTVLRNAEESINALGIQQLKAYLFHDASCIYDQEAVKALASVVDAGLAEKAGVSIYSPEEAVKALEYGEIRVIQIPYNVFDQRLDQCGFFEKARQRQVEVYARSSLLQGLVMMDPDNLPGRVRFASGYVRKFHRICREYNVSPLRGAVGYVLTHPGIDYVVFGVDNKRQLMEYIAMQEEGIPMEMKDALRNEFADVEERLVNPVLWDKPVCDAGKSTIKQSVENKQLKVRN